MDFQTGVTNIRRVDDAARGENGACFLGMGFVDKGARLGDVHHFQFRYDARRPLYQLRARFQHGYTHLDEYRDVSVDHSCPG